MSKLNDLKLVVIADILNNHSDIPEEAIQMVSFVLEEEDEHLIRSYLSLDAKDAFP